MSFRTIVSYEEMEEKIPESVREALLDLEAAGFSVLVEAKVEDARLKDGTRRPTFQMAGKYDLAIVVKNVDDVVNVETRISALSEENEQLGRINRNLKEKLGRRDKANEKLREELGELAEESERLVAEGARLKEQGAELERIQAATEAAASEQADPDAKAGDDSAKD